MTPAFAFKTGGATHLAHHQDQRVVEHASLFQIVDQRREGQVEARQQFALEPVVVIDVRVPAGVPLTVLVPDDGYEPATRLDQPPRRQG